MSGRYNVFESPVEGNSRDWLIPTRTGTHVGSKWDRDGCVLLLYVESIRYGTRESHSDMYAMDEEMACGFITALLSAMRQADVPINRMDALVSAALTALRDAHRGSETDR